MLNRIGALALVVLMLVGCCSHPEAMTAIDRAISVNKGHMNDASLPTTTHEVAQDNHDLWHKVKYDLDSDYEVPADVLERQKARSGGTQ